MAGTVGRPVETVSVTRLPRSSRVPVLWSLAVTTPALAPPAVAAGGGDHQVGLGEQLLGGGLGQAHHGRHRGPPSRPQPPGHGRDEHARAARPAPPSRRRSAGCAGGPAGAGPARAAGVGGSAGRCRVRVPPGPTGPDRRAGRGPRRRRRRRRPVGCSAGHRRGLAAGLRRRHRHVDLRDLQLLGHPAQLVEQGGGVGRPAGRVAPGGPADQLVQLRGHVAGDGRRRRHVAVHVPVGHRDRGVPGVRAARRPAARRAARRPRRRRCGRPRRRWRPARGRGRRPCPGSSRRG